MPSEYCLMHVGAWVTDLCAISCLGAGLAALVLTMLPGKKLTGKSEGADPSSFIDPGAGETARYRLAYKDLVTVKNSGQDITQVSGKGPGAPGESVGEGSRAMSASELAITMFDQGVLGIGLGERSLEATKSFSKTKVEKTKVESKIKIDTKTKIEKNKLDTKTKLEPKQEKKAPKKDAKKGEEKKDLQLNMAVRKITYGSKKTDVDIARPAIDEGIEQSAEQEIPDPLKPTYFTEDILGAMDRQPPSFLNQSAEPQPQIQQPAPGFPMQPHQPQGQGFPVAPNQQPTSGFPLPANQAPGFPITSNPAPGFPVPASQSPEPPQPQPLASEPEIQPEQIDPKKDPKKVGRSTLIEPRSNLQKDREPPPPEYFK